MKNKYDKRAGRILEIWDAYLRARVFTSARKDGERLVVVGKSAAGCYRRTGLEFKRKLRVGSELGRALRISTISVFFVDEFPCRVAEVEHCSFSFSGVDDQFSC